MILAKQCTTKTILPKQYTFFGGVTRSGNRILPPPLQQNLHKGLNILQEFQQFLQHMSVLRGGIRKLARVSFGINRKVRSCHPLKNIFWSGKIYFYRSGAFDCNKYIIVTTKLYVSSRKKDLSCMWGKASQVLQSIMMNWISTVSTPYSSHVDVFPILHWCYLVCTFFTTNGIRNKKQ